MSLKRHLKRAAGALCRGPFLMPLVASKVRHSVNVIYYHFVGGSVPHYDSFYTGCTLERFARDLEELSKVFAFASLADVIESNHTRNSTTAPTVAITFDDGFDLCRAGVADVLARYGVPATTFVITSCVGNQRLMWRHKLSAIRALADATTCIAEYNIIADRLQMPRIRSATELMKATTHWDMKAKDALADELWTRCHLPPEAEYIHTYKPYFSWEGLREWMAAGHAVGFHTHSHPYCSRLTEADLDAELIEPSLGLKAKLGLTDLCLSYPFGDRLPADLEDKLFGQGIFTALFGIGGFQKRGVSNQQLERAALEQDGVGWSVLARSLIPA